MPVKPARNNNFFLTASRWSIKVLRNLTQQCQNSLGQNIMHQNHHNYINRMQSNDDDYSARLKKHRLCISLFQAFQKGLNPRLKSAKQRPPPRKKKSLQGAPSKQTYRPTQELDFLHHFTKTKVQLFLGSPKGRLQLLTLRIQLQQFIIHFLCGFSVVFCNLGLLQGLLFSTHGLCQTNLAKE